MQSSPALAIPQLEQVVEAAQKGEQALKAICDENCPGYKNVASVCLLADITLKQECVAKYNYDANTGTYSGGKTEPTETPDQQLLRQMTKTGIFAKIVAEQLRNAMDKACKRLATITGEMAPRLGKLANFCERIPKPK